MEAHSHRVTWPRQLTNYSQHRSVSGRLASGLDDSDPDKGKRRKVHQVQNIPRKLRDAFVPDPGYVMVGADYAGIEWAIAMWFCAKLNEPAGLHARLLDDFRVLLPTGKPMLDPHRYLATFAFSVPEHKVTDKQRKVCKPYTHGHMFGGGPAGLAREIGHTVAVAKKVCAAHEKAFRPQAWWEVTGQQARERHYIQTPLGWRRYFWEYQPKITEILGTLVQGTAADLFKWMLVDLFKRLGQEAFDYRLFSEDRGSDPVEVLTSTHDSVLLQVREELKEGAPLLLLSCMEQPVEWLDGRSWRAEVKVGDSWRAVS